MNDLNEIIASLSGVILGVRNPRTGKVIEFSLARNENKYVYYQLKGGAKFCYTPHADREGWYYSWVYQPIGKGARTGEASHWKLTKLVAHRQRKAARKRAFGLYQKATALITR